VTRVSTNASTPRVVSLVPAATEILRSLGVEPVGVSHCCDALGLPVLTESIIPDGLDQLTIDQLVSQARATGQSLYRVKDIELEALKPDLILSQGVCDVCAVTDTEVARAVSCLTNAVPTLLVNGTRLADLFEDLRRVGQAIGLNAAPLTTSLQERIARVHEAVKSLEPPRTAMIEWLEPPFLAGHWVPEMLEAAGAVALGPAPGEPSPRTTWQAMRNLEPDVLLYSFCGYSLAQTSAALEPFEFPVRTPRLWALEARYFCALTPHVVRGIEILAGILHPKAFELPRPDEATRWP
jgi:iron complex transport system substrate-binding protein